MSTKYSNSPIIEAICSFNFLNENKWDWTIPGLIYNQIKEKYPIKRELRGIGVGLEFKSQNSDRYSNIISNVVLKVEGMQFLNKDQNKLIQLKKNMISVNILKPYSLWGDFKKRILDALNVYSKLTKPTGILRIGLRYINKLEFMPEKFEIEEYFNYYPTFPKKDQSTTGELVLKSTLPMPNIEKIEGFLNLVLFLNSKNILDKKTNHLLDLDMVFLREKNDYIKIEEAEIFLEKAHKFIFETFESCITDKLREIIR